MPEAPELNVLSNQLKSILLNHTIDNNILYTQDKFQYAH